MLPINVSSTNVNDKIILNPPIALAQICHEAQETNKLFSFPAEVWSSIFNSFIVHDYLLLSCVSKKFKMCIDEWPIVKKIKNILDKSYNFKDDTVICDFMHIDLANSLMNNKRLTITQLVSKFDAREVFSKSFEASLRLNLLGHITFEELKEMTLFYNQVNKSKPIWVFNKVCTNLVTQNLFEKAVEFFYENQCTCNDIRLTILEGYLSEKQFNEALVFFKDQFEKMSFSLTLSIGKKFVANFVEKNQLTEAVEFFKDYLVKSKERLDHELQTYRYKEICQDYDSSVEILVNGIVKKIDIYIAQEIVKTYPPIAGDLLIRLSEVFDNKEHSSDEKSTFLKLIEDNREAICLTFLSNLEKNDIYDLTINLDHCFKYIFPDTEFCYLENIDLNKIELEMVIVNLLKINDTRIKPMLNYLLPKCSKITLDNMEIIFQSKLEDDLILKIFKDKKNPFSYYSEEINLIIKERPSILEQYISMLNSLSYWDLVLMMKKGVSQDILIQVIDKLYINYESNIPKELLDLLQQNLTLEKHFFSRYDRGNPRTNEESKDANRCAQQ